MAAGDTLTAEYQIELWKSDTNRLLIGADTHYHILQAKGLSKVGVVSSDFDRQAGHGAYVVSPERMPGRQIDLEVLIQSNSYYDNRMKLDRLLEFFNPVRKPTMCTLLWPARPTVRCEVYPREAEWDENANKFMGGVKIIYLEMFVPDPIFYSNYLYSSNAWTLNSPAVTTTQDLINIGNIEVDLTFSIVGPATNLIITNITDSKAIRVDYILSAVDTLVIDTKARTAYLNGVRRNDILKTDNQWWRLQPGVNSISFSRSNTNGTAVTTITHRAGWSGV